MDKKVATHHQIYTRCRYISREPCFFVLLSLETDTRPSYNPGPPPPPLLRASAQNGMTTNCLKLIRLIDCSLSWSKTSVVLYFRTPTCASNAIHEAFPLSFAYLERQLHILFEIHKLTDLSKDNM